MATREETPPSEVPFNWLSSTVIRQWPKALGLSKQVNEGPGRPVTSGVPVMWVSCISAVFNEQIYRVGGIPAWSFGECLIGYDEPFLRLHRLGEEACLWCAEITELRGLTSYALTHIKQALWFFSFFPPPSSVFYSLPLSLLARCARLGCLRLILKHGLWF